MTSAQTLLDLSPSDMDLKKPLILVPPTISIHDALILLAKHNKLSLAVSSHSNPKKVVNILNIFDLLTFLVSKFGRLGTGSNPDELKMTVESAMSLDPDRER